ncbi:FIST N-terminal domain-containing protein [Aquisalimonas lutea]|uniref:FIST N-terminal domain-containing protein n=1 Tax=Aquisalimonas lutea TaxID=1327750 RepID=UPI0025B2CDE1|nr:FIST N-terminal domain-containing protein [Aquisalimonas lutea]MDN3518215.1 FIST N-terminal domain-containing protein [Aquisalimonas lutea]
MRASAAPLVAPGAGQAVHQAVSEAGSPRQAAAELRRQLAGSSAAALVVFCSSEYAGPEFGRALRRCFPDIPLLGCTGSALLTPRGYIGHGVMALALDARWFRVRTQLICRASTSSLSAIQEQVAPLLEIGAHARGRFGLLFVDGLCLAEERLASALGAALGAIPMIGGSAGDDFEFRDGHVLNATRWHRDAAVVAVVECDLPFQTFSNHHFLPGEDRLLVTDADPDHRTVTELNGEPAAAAYARALGLRQEQLDLDVFAHNPLVVRIGQSIYVRSIQQVCGTPSGALRLTSAIDTGVVLRLGKRDDLLRMLEQELARVEAELGPLDVVIGCDCALRFEELLMDDRLPAARDLIRRFRIGGLSTLGEQLHMMHLNQTFTGIAIGRPDRATP